MASSEKRPRRNALERERGTSTLQPQRSESRHEQDRHEQVPRKGERIELLLPRLGIRKRGTVFYADGLQVLVKWDDGRSESLRPGTADRFRIIEDTAPP